MPDPIIVKPSTGDIVRFKLQLKPEQQVEIYTSVAKQGLELFGPLTEQVNRLLEENWRKPPDEAAPALKEGLTGVYSRLTDYVGALAGALEIPLEDVELLRKQLDQYRARLAEAQGTLLSAQEEIEKLAAASAQQKGQLAAQQARIDALQERNNALEAHIAELEGRSAVDPAGLGAALGQAVDAIQLALTSLTNPHVDYGLQELDLQTRANLQVSAAGRLVMRFPGINEEVAPHNLSEIHLLLRPIPKTQASEGGG